MRERGRGEEEERGGREREGERASDERGRACENGRAPGGRGGGTCLRSSSSSSSTNTLAPLRAGSVTPPMSVSLAKAATKKYRLGKGESCLPLGQAIGFVPIFQRNES